MLQPLEMRDGVFVAWSMGNFLSSQRYQNDGREWVDGSALLSLEINRDSSGKARVITASFIPLYVHWTRDDIRVLAVTDGLDPGGKERYSLSEYDLQRLETLEYWVPAQTTRYLGSIPARKLGAGWEVDFYR